MPSVSFSEELTSVGWCFASIFVFEIGVNSHALAKPGVEAFSPGCDLLRSVVFKSQAGVGEVGSKHIGRRLLVGLGQAKRRLVLTKNGICFVGVPRRMADLESESEGGWAKSKKILQQRTIEFEVGRQLNEDWAQVVAVV